MTSPCQRAKGGLVAAIGIRRDRWPGTVDLLIGKGPLMLMLLLIAITESSSAVPTLSADLLRSFPAEDRYPCWSPDGTQIAFQSNRSGNTDLYVMDRDGEEVRQITSHQAGDYYPTWTPDGKGLIFSTDRNGRAELGRQDLDVYSIDVDTGKLTALVTDGANEIFPRMSPDGNKVAYVSDHVSDRRVYHLMVRDLATQSDLNLTPMEFEAFDPVWSPEGDQLVYSAPNPLTKDNKYDLFLVNADGTGTRVLTSNPDHDFNADWSPDGFTLAYQAPVNGVVQIHLFDLETGDSYPVTEVAAHNDSPNWSPDGSEIAFVSQRDGNLEIYRMNADGSDVVRLTNQ